MSLQVCYTSKPCGTLAAEMVLGNHGSVSVVGTHPGDGSGLGALDEFSIRALLKTRHGLCALSLLALLVLGRGRHDYT
jgi:hypothetical protein